MQFKQNCNVATTQGRVHSFGLLVSQLLKVLNKIECGSNQGNISNIE